MSGEENGPGRRPRRLYVFVAGVTALAVVGTAWSWWRFGPPQNPTAFVACLALGLLSEAVRSLDVAGRRVDLSFFSIIQLASVPALGPAGSALFGFVAQFLAPRRTPFVPRLFNASMLALTGVAGGVGYQLAGGTLDMTTTGAVHLLRQLAFPLGVADVIQMVVNAACMAGVINADSGRPFRVQFRDMISSSGLAYLGYGAIGFLFVVLWFPAHVGPLSAVLILAPLLVARWIIAQYAEEVRSHESALSGLVTAAEIKDPASKGHSRRVATLAEWMVEPLGLSAVQAAELRVAAQLHDVGKVAVATRVVRYARSAEPDDLIELSEHAVRGAELLNEVSFAADSLPAIRHHHERWDGRGYPDALAGVEIPLSARIIAVADAFDALTTARPDRSALATPDALAVVGERAGTQFDPDVVRALARALERHEWTPTTWSDDELLMMGRYLDHDHPEASDLLAGLLHPERPLDGPSHRGAEVRT